MHKFFYCRCRLQIFLVIIKIDGKSKKFVKTKTRSKTCWYFVSVLFNHRYWNLNVYAFNKSGYNFDQAAVLVFCVVPDHTIFLAMLIVYHFCQVSQPHHRLFVYVSLANRKVFLHSMELCRPSLVVVIWGCTNSRHEWIF